MDFKDKLIALLIKETRLKKDEIAKLIAVPPDPKLGDLAFPCFKLGKNAKNEAEKLKEKIKLPKFISKIKVAGPYLNFFWNTSGLAKETLDKIKKEKEKYGCKIGNKNIVIEFCGPNTNKPLHLGHVRNMALGEAVCNLLSCQGNKIHPVNIVNDRGIHIMQSMLAYQKWGKDKKPNKKGDHFVGDYYVIFSKKAKNNERLSAEAQDLLLKWENKDKKTRELWKKMNQWVLTGFKETYQRFGIKFEKEYFESDYFEKGKKLVEKGLKKGIFQKKNERMSIGGKEQFVKGVVALLEKFNLPNKIVLRGDGTSVYITQDMHLADLRHKDFKYDRLIYVVASEQKLHFQQLFKILEMLRKPYAKKLFHLSYGLVNLPSGRMKSREGTVVDADDIMDEVVSLAEKEIKKRHKKLSAKEVKERAEMIGLGAIKFFMLKIDAARDMVFNPEESISFEGETGPYVQYAHARACSVLRKAKKVKENLNFEKLKTSQEKTVINLLSKFPEIVKDAADNYKPHMICRYLIELTQAFNEFYHQCQVISEDKGLMKARLALVEATKIVLSNGLGLLGIRAPEEM